MLRRAGWIVLATAAGLAILVSACTAMPAGTGDFERTLSVTGPVRLELQNGSGSVQINAGEAGQVRIHGEVRVHAWSLENAQRQVAEIVKNPPIEQQGNLIRIGSETERMRSATVSYTIVVPVETELQTTVGSGRLDVRGVHGPAKLATGSGAINAENIREDVQATAGSGGIRLANVEGEVRATTGSGSITLNQIGGEVRAQTGSGRITIEEPGGRVTAKTGSGGVTVNGAAADLRASTGSGHVTIEGNPAPNCYWELHAGSGGVEIGVPVSASFRLYARASSGRIETGIPMVIEERSKRELRARIGSGAARVEVHSGSGSVQIR